MTAELTGYVLGDEGFEWCEQVEITGIGGDAKTTVPDYVSLAHSLGGTAWQIGAFRGDGMARLSLIQLDLYPVKARQKFF